MSGRSLLETVDSQQIALDVATPRDAVLLSNLLELYAHDLSGAKERGHIWNVDFRRILVHSTSARVSGATQLRRTE